MDATVKWVLGCTLIGYVYTLFRLWIWKQHVRAARQTNLELASQLRDESGHGLQKQIVLTQQNLELLRTLMQVTEGSVELAQRSQDQLLQLEHLQRTANDLFLREEKLKAAFQAALRGEGADEEAIEVAMEQVLGVEED